VTALGILRGYATMARMRFFPWNPSQRGRRYMATFGLVWLMFTIWAWGVMMGANAFEKDPHPVKLFIGGILHMVVALGLLRMAPKRMCKACGATA